MNASERFSEARCAFVKNQNDIFILKENEVYSKDGNTNCGCNQDPCVNFGNSDSIQKRIELFPWEKLDYVNIIKKEFNL